MRSTLNVALIHEVFPGPGHDGRLVELLRQAASRGADLALLPELGVDRWIPADRDVREDDGEPPDGPRQRRQAAAAREAGIALLGGAIVRGDDGRRTNRALAFDADGRLLGHYDKQHLPCEAGFWESDHYVPGDEPAEVIDALDFPFGIQICSDLNRPAACQQLALGGALAIFAARATPPDSYDRWRTVIRADAITSAAYVVSVNRPRDEGGASIGGPSVAFGPDGTALAETTDPLTVVTLHRDAVESARRDYPGYLEVRAGLYARGWTRAARRRP